MQSARARLIALVITTVFVTGSYLATAAPRTTAGSPNRLSAADAQRMHTLTTQTARLNRDRTLSSAQIDSKLRKRGFVRVSSAPTTRTLMDTNGDMVTMVTPSIYFDTVRLRYYATARYYWEGYPQAFDFGPAICPSSCNVGGQDGFGMRFNRALVNQGVDAQICGAPNPQPDTFGCTLLTNPDDNSSSGVSWRRQDKIGWHSVYDSLTKPDYNMYSGVTTMAIARPPCGITQLYGSYAHTWDSTAVSGFGVSLTGFSLSWSGGGSHWRATSQAGTFTRNC